LTWQASPRNKISVYGLHQYECQCHTQAAGAPPRSPEGTQVQAFPVNQLIEASWSFPATNRLLYQAGALVYRQHLAAIPSDPSVTPNTIAVTELSTGLQYRAFPTYNETHHKQETYRGSVNYVTGTHAFKAGFTLQRGERATQTYVNDNISFQFLNGVPRSLTEYATPYANTEHLDRDFGLYAQDQWTTRRLTVTAGLRFDQIKASIPAQQEPAVEFSGQRSFAAVPDVPNWKNVSPRLGLSYDPFGKGKTALKVSLNRYVLGELLDFAAANNPVTTSVNSVTRTWTDSNHNFVPDCMLTNPVANGECGNISNVNFAKPNVSTRYDDQLKTGWNARGYDWEISGGVQHELMTGVSASATYVRRWYGNFQVTDNLAVTPADYSPFCAPAPADPRLPGGGAYQVCGLYDVSPSKFGQSNNLVTFAKTYGTQSDIYNGVDVNVIARLPRQVFLQGGLNVGREETNNCFVVNSPQQLLNCDVKPPFFMPQIKTLVVYPLPWRLQTSATFQTAPGPEIDANYTATNAQVQASLGRNLAAGANGTVTVPLIKPGTLFGERLYQADVRFTKTLTLGRIEPQLNFDVYNAFNASPVLTQNNTYGPAWQQPIYILPGRLLKLSVQVNF
jgi:outer membrane receptor protein involved in Fe transport